MCPDRRPPGSAPPAPAPARPCAPLPGPPPPAGPGAPQNPRLGQAGESRTAAVGAAEQLVPQRVFQLVLGSCYTEVKTIKTPLLALCYSPRPPSEVDVKW